MSSRRPSGTAPALNREDAAHASTRYTCAKIVEEEEISLGVSASEGFVAALAELVFAQAGTSAALDHVLHADALAETLGRDLESFSKCAQRP
jgi:hypothetical protein